MNKDEYIVALAEVGVGLSSTKKMHYEALAKAIGYPEALDRIWEKIVQYPAPLIPKRELLAIIREEEEG